MGNSGEISHVEDRNELDREDYAPPEVQKGIQLLDTQELQTARKKYLRKLDLIILPTISALYFFECLDRGNIAVHLSQSVKLFET